MADDMEDQTLKSSGGFCAPMSAPCYDFFGLGDPVLSDAACRAAERAVREWCDTTGREAMAALAATSDEADGLDVVALVSRPLVEVAVKAYLSHRSPVEDCLPTISAPRGTIKFLVPPEVSKVTRRQRLVGRWRRVTSPVVVRWRRAIDARERFRNARSVWQGHKTAYTDAEVEDMQDW